MQKHDRVLEFIGNLDTAGKQEHHHSCYVGYFLCFNKGEYYEAHDVLEHIWLSSQGQEYRYFKGLIQLAGAFVHLQKNFKFPDHPKHRTRMRPADRLFLSAANYLQEFPPVFRDLDIASVIEICTHHSQTIRKGHYLINPWSPDELPVLQPHFLAPTSCR